MAEKETEQITPVATPAVSAPVAPSTLATPLLKDVYSPTNVSQIDIPSGSSASAMKLSDMENKLAKASSQAELNQIDIMNQPKRMGVLTGEAAHQGRLDTARVNAFNNLYNNRLMEEQRKDEERQLFMQNYGADPSQRPKGMSKKEFQSALQAGQFQELLTPEFKEARDAAARVGSGGSGAIQSTNIVNASSALQASKGGDNYVNPNEYVTQRDIYVANTPGTTYDDFDSQFSGMLNPRDYQTVGFNPAQVEKLTSTTEQKPMSATTAEKMSNVISGLQSITNLEGMDMGWGNRLQEKLPGALGARNLRFEYDNVRDILQRMRTGAAISATEEAFYKEQIPGLLDNESERKRKLESLKGLFSRIQNAIDPTGQMSQQMMGGSNFSNSDPLGLGI